MRLIKNSGFTLIEVLVSLSLLGFMMFLVLNAGTAIWDRGPDDAFSNVKDQRSQNIRDTLQNMSHGTQRDAFLSALGYSGSRIVTEYLVTPDFPWVAAPQLASVAALKAANQPYVNYPFVSDVDETTVTITDIFAMHGYLSTEVANGGPALYKLARNSPVPVPNGAGMMLQTFYQAGNMDQTSSGAGKGVLLWVVQTVDGDSKRAYVPAVLMIRQIPTTPAAGVGGSLLVALLTKWDMGGSTVQGVMAGTNTSNLNGLEASVVTAMDHLRGETNPVLVGFDVPTRTPPVQYAYSVTYQGSSRRSYRNGADPATFSLLSSIVPLYNETSGPQNTYRITLPHPYDLDAVPVQATRILTGAPLITPQNLYVDFANSFVIQSNAQ